MWLGLCRVTLGVCPPALCALRSVGASARPAGLGLKPRCPGAQQGKLSSVTPCEAEAGRQILGVVGRVGAGRDTPGGAACLPAWLLLGKRSAGIVPEGCG